MGGTTEGHDSTLPSASSTIINANVKRDGEQTNTSGLQDFPDTPVGEKSPVASDPRVFPPVSAADPNLVSWDGPDDPHNPQAWSRLRKWYITFLCSLMTFNVCVASIIHHCPKTDAWYRSFSSSAPTSATLHIQARFQTQDEVSYLITSVFLFGYVAGPIFWGPGSEVFGRKPIFRITMVLYTAFILGQALAQNMETLLVTRFFSGFFGCAPLTISGGVFADVWDPITRGPATSIFATMVFLGPVLGPIVSGL